MAYNVLIVDDSSIVRKVLVKAFSLTELPVNSFHEAANGLEALNILKEHWIDIIFLDINMPVMNGMEFVRALAAEERLKQTPIVVISTDGSKERRAELEKAGIKAYLRKPVTPESLVDTITEVLGELKNV